MAPRRRTRARGPPRAASIRTPTPQVEPSDEETQETEEVDAVIPQDEGSPHEANDDDEDDDDEDEEEVNGSGASTPARSRRSAVELRRRPGRPAKQKPVGWDSDDEKSRPPSDAGTPRKRGGWRGRGFGAGRWAKAKGGPSHVTQVPVDKEGNMADVRDDEIVLPEDPEGETKVDKNGVLLGNREYRVRVFTIQGKGDRLYMLSTEPARCIGFRDSYLFFQKHRTLYKIIVPEDAKKDLIDRNIIPHSYKGRAIGVVTARSVFREFGARIIIGGKRVIDDYQAAAAREEGAVEGELAVPDDQMPAAGQSYDKNRYVAWHGASNVYHSGMPTVPVPGARPGEVKKKKVQVTGTNWLLAHAQAASRFNSELAAKRLATMDGVYDPHTNHLHYPKITQPSHVRWEQIYDEVPAASQLRAIGGDASEHIFDPLPEDFKRNFMTVDTYYTHPPVSGLGTPGPDGEAADLNKPGLVDVPDDVLAALPAEYMAEFREARQMEYDWKHVWGKETQNCDRADIKITYSGLMY